MGVNPRAQTALDALIEAYGSPLPVISGYRDPEHNRRVGGASNSQHVHGNAFDLDVSSMPHSERLRLADLARGAGFQGFGFYDNSLHFDVGDPRYWGPSHRSDSTPDWAMDWVRQNFGDGSVGGGSVGGGSVGGGYVGGGYVGGGGSSGLSDFERMAMLPPPPSFGLQQMAQQPAPRPGNVFLPHEHMQLASAPELYSRARSELSGQF